LNLHILNVYSYYLNTVGSSDNKRGQRSRGR